MQKGPRILSSSTLASYFISSCLYLPLATNPPPLPGASGCLQPFSLPLPTAALRTADVERGELVGESAPGAAASVVAREEVMGGRGGDNKVGSKRHLPLETMPPPPPLKRRALCASATRRYFLPVLGGTGMLRSMAAIHGAAALVRWRRRATLCVGGGAEHEDATERAATGQRTRMRDERVVTGRARRCRRACCYGAEHGDARQARGGRQST
jgi:hypothetical protein